MRIHGWYLASNARVSHYLDEDGVSLCRRVRVLVPTYEPEDDDPAKRTSKDCTTCCLRLDGRK